MANPWFRMYAEFLHDPKVRVMSETDQLRLVLLFCLRCNGSVTLQDKHVTFSMRISDAEWQQTKAVFIESGFIDSDNNVLNWDKRQYVSDSSAARVAKHRALHKPVTETKRNVTVTPPEQNRTEQKQIKPMSEYSDGFLNFWGEWPNGGRKGGKSECWKFWQAKRLDAEQSAILRHIAYCKKSGLWKDPQYIEAPIVYLRAAKWDGAELGGNTNKPFDMQEFQRQTGAIPT